MAEEGVQWCPFMVMVNCLGNTYTCMPFNLNIVRNMMSYVAKSLTAMKNNLTYIVTLWKWLLLFPPYVTHLT
jgi:hypothetical protein